MRRYCLTLDLKDDPAGIAEYESHHKNVWPEILRSIRESGIETLEIYRFQTRLFMLMDVTDSFSFEKKNASDMANPRVQQWETLMWKYQQALPSSTPGEKWKVMDKIFEL
jgi:L-rhamnose mutarotase